jgi:hypothetical protein
MGKTVNQESYFPQNYPSKRKERSRHSQINKNGIASRNGLQKKKTKWSMC